MDRWPSLGSDKGDEQSDLGGDNLVVGNRWKKGPGVSHSFHGHSIKGRLHPVYYFEIARSSHLTYEQAHADLNRFRQVLEVSWKPGRWAGKNLRRQQVVIRKELFQLCSFRGAREQHFSESAIKSNSL